MNITTWALRVALPLLCVAHALHAQNFTPPEVWTSEDFTNQRTGTPLLQVGGDFAWNSSTAPHTAIGNNYQDMIYALPGNFNGAFNVYDNIGTSIPSVAYLFDVNGHLSIYTLESRGYRVNTVTSEYGDQDVVNAQEGIALLADSNTHRAYTYHPTIWRFDQTVRPIQTSKIKAAVAGDFNGDQQDEIALFVKYGTDQNIIVIHCDNYFGDLLSYQMKMDTVMSVSEATLDFDRIKFACAGKYTEGNSKIAVLYDDIGGMQQIYTFERGGPWSMQLQYSQPASTFDIDNVRYVVSGRFEPGSTAPRLGICYYDPVSDAAQILVSHDNGPSWSLNTYFDKPTSEIDYDKVRGVVAGNFDDDGSNEELAIFYDHGDDATGLGSVQQVLVTNHDTPTWDYTVAINEKRSAMDFDLILHAYAANLDYNSGTRRDDIGIVYNDQGGPTDGQDFRSDKVLVYVGKPSFAENDFMIAANQPVADPTGVAPFFPLGWGGVRLDEIEGFAQRAQGAYNTLWCNSLPFGEGQPSPVPEEVAYEEAAVEHGLFTIPEPRYEHTATTTEHTTMIDNIADRAAARYPNSVLAWMTADEPNGGHHNPPPSGPEEPYTTANLDEVNAAIRGEGADEPFTPIVSHENGAEFFRDQLDVVSVDGYPYIAGNPFLRAPVHAALMSVFVPHRAMESAIRYNKQGLVFIAQGFGMPKTTSDAQRFPSFDEMRYNALAPVIEGARGLLYYRYTNGFEDELIRHRVDLVVEELSHYVPALSTQSLTGRVTIDRHFYVPADFNAGPRGYENDAEPRRVDYKGGKSRFMNLFSYTLHKDPAANRYYLFVANNWSLPVENVELTAFGVPGTVSLLHPEYFQNGHFTPVAARVDNAGDYVTFTDSFEGNEVKVYAIGELPGIVPAPDATVEKFAGDLSFSNQRKLVGAPVTTDIGAGLPVYSDNIYYHLTYHRLDPVSGRMKVYYRRSALTPRATPMETAQWEPWELCLSDDIVSTGGTSLGDLSCAHPSIVVRYDMASHTNKAYVVFDCQGGPEAPGGYIVESVIAADAATPVAPVAQGLASHTGRSLEEWGAPMINASSNGNYYVWADSLSGIVAGWKRPQESLLVATTQIHWNASDFKAQHPSLNSYSHIGDQEDNCALVWQESSGEEHPHIYYTRLRGDNSGIANYMPTQAANRLPLKLNTPTNTIGRVDLPNPSIEAANRMPTVFRNVEVGQAGAAPVADQYIDIFDRIYWEVQPHRDAGSGTTTIPKWMMYKQIGHRGVDLVDSWSGTRWEPAEWDTEQMRWIRSIGSDLTQPTASQGSYYDWVGDIFASDSAVNLNFTATDGETAEQSIWDIPHNYYSITSRPADQFGTMGVTSLSHARKILGPANSPQLAAIPFVRNEHDWFRSQRVFNSGSALSVVASRHYFVKTALQDLDACPLVGFRRDDAFSVVSPFQLDGVFIPLALPMMDTTNPKPTDPGDTVRTGWFTVGDAQTLDFAVFGENISGAIGGGEMTEIWLERKLTGARVRLTLPAGDNEVAEPVAYSLVHGLDEEYRLLVVNRDPDAYYTEQLVLDGLPMADSTYADSSSLTKGGSLTNRNIIDLGTLRGEATTGGATLSVYPNPVTDKVVITLGGASNELARSGGKAMLTVVSPLGTVVKRQEIELMRGMELAVDGWPNGVYFVRVGNGAVPLATARFVIQR